VVSSTPRTHVTPWEGPSTHFAGGWVGPRAGLDGQKSRPHRDSIPDCPARSQSLYQLSYLAHTYMYILLFIKQNGDVSPENCGMSSVSGPHLIIRFGIFLDTLQFSRYVPTFWKNRTIVLTLTLLQNFDIYVFFSGGIFVED